MRNIAFILGVALAAFAGAAELDCAKFRAPGADCRPETWYHLIGPNASKEGATADLEALAAAGVGGIQLFHGGAKTLDDLWPGVKKGIPCLSADWDDLVAHIADECHRLGLTFKMQNCPGWSMAGGPWITNETCMRDLAWTVGTFESAADGTVRGRLEPSHGGTRDYHDLRVLAFPAPAGAETASLVWTNAAAPGPGGRRPPPDEAVLESATGPVTVRTLALPNPKHFTTMRTYDPEMTVTLEAWRDGAWTPAGRWTVPPANWQDGMLGPDANEWMSLAVDETTAAKFRVRLHHPAYALARFDRAALLGVARPNNWEGEAGYSLRGLVREGADAACAAAAVVDPAAVLTPRVAFAADGSFAWRAPRAGRWTLVRVGEERKTCVNAPAPPVATGLECDKLSPRGIEANYANYVGRLVKGPLREKIDGMLLDSWECGTQTWTKDLDKAFDARHGAGRFARFLPALCGFVTVSRAETREFLRQWRLFLGETVARNFYGRMRELARADGLSIAFETAHGDVLPGCPLEYFKYADTPMCEFWTQGPDDHCANVNMKAIRPCASAAHIYGKRRVDCESFTDCDLGWDENPFGLKPHLDVNFARGITHPVLHTCTHNPVAKLTAPGSSFGAWGIGTPFVRGQTWWGYMPDFTGYASRCTYMLEAGAPKVDVALDLGDDGDHKPLHFLPGLDRGYSHDLVNRDALATQFVRDGAAWRTKGGATYGCVLARREVEEGRAKPPFPPSVTFAAGGPLEWIARTDGTRDWYFFAVPQDGRAHAVKLRDFGAGAKFAAAEIWNPRTARTEAAVVGGDGALALSESCFVVLGPKAPGASAPAVRRRAAEPTPLAGPWLLRFEPGWGRDEDVTTDRLVSWDELPGSMEAQFYSGRVTYVKRFDWPGGDARLEIPGLKGLAEVRVNGVKAGRIWCAPCELELAGVLRRGGNELEIEVTSPWRNRLLWESRHLPPEMRKTWTVAYPKGPRMKNGIVGDVLLGRLEGPDAPRVAVADKPAYLLVDLRTFATKLTDELPSAQAFPPADTDTLLLRRVEIPSADGKGSATLYAGAYEVLQGQWTKLAGDNPSYFNRSADAARRPVESVPFDRAEEFLRVLSARTGLRFRLPTTVEMKAAAGPIPAQPEFSGRFWENGGEEGERTFRRSGGTAPAGSYRPNAFGLYDLFGNVREWCSDCVPDHGINSRYLLGGAWGMSVQGWRQNLNYRADRASEAPTSGFRAYTALEPCAKDPAAKMGPGAVHPVVKEADAPLSTDEIRALWTAYFKPPKECHFRNRVTLLKKFDWPECDGELYEQANGPGTVQRVLLTFPKKFSGRIPVVVTPYYMPEGMVARNFDTGEDQKGNLEVAFMRHAAARGWAAVCGDSYHLTAIPDSPRGRHDFNRWHDAAEAIRRQFPAWCGEGKKHLDTRLLVDLATADPRIDARRVGIIGHSLGGQTSYYAGMLDSRIKVVVASDFALRFDQSFWETPWYWWEKLYTARRQGLRNEQAALLGGGKPFCMIAGKMDDDSSCRAVLGTGVYDAHPENFLFLNHATRHRPPAYALEMAWRFMERHL